MITCFLESYQPEKLIHRDKQLETIKKTFTQFRQFGVGTNLVIMGVTGSGKTTAVKSIINSENNCLYYSASNSKTTFKILKDVSGVDTRDSSEFLRVISNDLKNNKKILIIDELNKLDDVVPLFDSINTIFRNTSIPIILISNNRKIFSEMPDDARLTLFFHYVEFPAYTPKELYDILSSRLQVLSKELAETIPKECSEYISMICAEDGSARNALDFLMKCILNSKFDSEFIEELRKDKKRQEWEDFARDLNQMERKFLKTLLDFHISEEEITNHSIRKLLPELSPQRVSQLMTVFERYGLLDIEKINLGRKGGAYRIAHFDNDAFCKLNGII